MIKEEQDLLDLQRWEAAQSEPPTLLDVLATGNIGFFSAYVLRAFRAAAAIAVEERERVARVRQLILGAFDGDAARMEAFLRNPSKDLGGLIPLKLAVESEEGAERVIDAAERQDDQR